MGDAYSGPSFVKETQDEIKLVSSIMARFAVMKRERQLIEPMWKEITDYLYPRRSGWSFESDARLSAGDKVFDGAGIASHRMLADGIYGWLVSPSIDWLDLVPFDRKDEDNRELMVYCRDLKMFLYDVWDRSGFYDVMSEDITDCSALGTSVIVTENSEELGRPVFTPLHLREVYLSENRFGVADTLFRDFEITKRQLMEKFPSRISAQRRKEYLRDPEGTVRVLHAVYPRAVYDDGSGPRMKEEKLYASIYILQSMSSTGSTQLGGTLLENGGADRRQFDAWRFQKVSNQVYGGSPAMDAIFDVKMINLQAKTMADVAQLAARPPLQVPESMRGKLNIAPGGISYSYGDGDAKPIMTTLSYPFGVDSMARREQVIRQIFKTDYFQVVTQIQNSSRQRTATEIAAIKSEGAAVLGPIISRATSERVGPIVFQTIANELEAKRLPPPPAGVDPKIRLKLKYIGPLAQAQRRYLRIEGISTGLGQALQFSGIDPDIQYEFKIPQAAREIAVASGYPQEFLNSIEDAKKLRKAAQEARMAAAAEQAQNEAMAAAASGGKAPEPGSMLARKLLGQE